MGTLAIPCFLAPRGQGSDKRADPIMRRAVGALRYDYEVRLLSKADLVLLYRGLFCKTQVYTITEYKSFVDIRAAQCSVSWLLKQKEKQNAQN